jgi:hypothetical protein
MFSSLGDARRRAFAALCLIAFVLAGCTGSSPSTSTSTSSFSVTLGLASVGVFPDGTLSPVAAIVTRPSGNTASVSLSVSGVPAGVTVAVVQPLLGNYGSITLSGSSTTAAGSYTLTVTASDGTATSTATLPLTVYPVDTLALSVASANVLALQDGTPAVSALSLTRATGYSKTVTVSASGLPTGFTATFVQPGAGLTGTVTFAAAKTPAAAGMYNVTLTATDGTASSTAAIAVTVGVVATVSNAVDTTLGVSGHFQEFMSTGFQPSVFNNSFFVNFPATASLAALNPKHIRLQPVHATIPWVANSSPQATSDWSFTGLDQTVLPVLATGDSSPMMQIAAAPLFLSDASGHFILNSANLTAFTSYAQNLVRYYNTGGFDWAGKHFQSTSSTHITWWAIFNEPNLNSITPAQYVQIYNTLVPAMLSVDPTLKFVGLELSDYTGQPALYLPTLVLPATGGGIAAQMDAISTHFYGSCNQTTTDAATFAKAPQFAADVTYFRTTLKTRADLANVPVWVTEDNVNADYNLPTGYSNCNPTQLFVSDPRGSNGYFTAWRPYVFSQLGKAGNQALYHFLYEGSNQYGEVSSTTAAKTLAYWTDYWLQHVFPWDGTAVSGTVLKTTTTEPTSSVEVLAVRNTDNSVSLMVVDFSVAAAADNNGVGAPRTVMVDISGLGTFSSGTQVSLNAGTSPISGPASVTFTPTAVLTVSLGGYGSALYVLKP